MFIFPLFLFLSITSSSWYRPSWVPPIWDVTCTYTREDVFNCFKVYVDTSPKDEQITKTEIEQALGKYLPTYLKPLIWGADTGTILDSCDFDHNGVITSRDWMLSKQRCLPFKNNWCTAQWFCERAQNGKK